MAGFPSKPPLGTRVTLEVHCFRWQKTDRANLIGGCKALVDALVNEGFLTDDSETYLDDSYAQEVDRKNRRTRVRLTWS